MFGLVNPTFTIFCCLTFSFPLTGKVASESISLDLPVDVVPDSTKAYVSVLGKQLEILGSKGGAGGCGVGWGMYTYLKEGVVD